jgi:hypothetical protein
MNSIFSLFLLLSFSSGYTQVVTKAENPIRKIDKIFKAYIKNSESTDTDENKAAVKAALSALQQGVKADDLYLLVNVWMYYDPTDFPTRELVEPVFNKNKRAALLAVNKRLKNKKKWENKETAPYSDLVGLKERLSKKKTGNFTN